MADKRIPLPQLLLTVLLQRISDSTHFDEVSQDNLYLFNFTVIYVNRIVKNVNPRKSGEGVAETLVFYGFLIDVSLFHK